MNMRKHIRRHSVVVLLTVLFASACTRTDAGTEAAPAAPPSDYAALLDEVWEFELREDPLFATGAGDHRYDDRLPAVTLADESRRAESRRTFLARVQAIDTTTLDDQQRITRAMLVRQLRDRIGEYDHGSHFIPFTADDGFHIGFARLPGDMQFVATSDYENYIARLRAFPAYVEQQMTVMREGLRRGFSMPRIVLEGYDVTMSSHVVTDPATSLFWSPFTEFPVAVPAAERERLLGEGRAAIMEGVVAGYTALLTFWNDEYVPAARETIGASELPDGRDFYAHRVRLYTTLDLTPEQVHQTGLDEVARIRAEMENVIRESGFSGDFAAFLQFLRTDQRFYARTPEQLLERAAWIAKKMDGALPALFGTLPRQPYTVAPVPDHLAPKYTGGRYVPAAPGGTQPGTYWVNTYALDSRPLYVLESLTLHEAVPGHHLQYALARELEGQHPVRRFAELSAFSEGWALYSERLGLEAGFYSDPYSNFGRLTYEMWRACRLVVDTGIHAMGWTRDQAMEFLASNTALSLHEVRTETDRYISWPGQALAYKIGELKIRELRAAAEQAMGGNFDIRQFHDVILRNGPVPLDVLDTQVRSWITGTRN
jgi:uncharacterized protein (DUF885 family)